MADRAKAVMLYLWLLVLTAPLFFSILRTAVFETTPRDDYAPYLQYLVGDGGRVMGAPYGYRILSVIIAAPLYHVVPTIGFSNAPATDPAYARATEALSLVSFLAILAGAGVVMAVARLRYSVSSTGALAGGLIYVLATSFTQVTAIDPVGLLVVALLTAAINRRVLFPVLVLVSVGFNEKIPIFFAVALASALLWCVVRRQQVRRLPQSVAAFVAVAIYFTARRVVNLPGNEGQTDISHFALALRSTLAASLSTRGVVLNVLPLGLLLACAVTAVMLTQDENNGARVRWSDLVGVLAIVGTSLLADVGLNVGRLALYTLPFFLPASLVMFSARRSTRPLEDRGADVSTG